MDERLITALIAGLVSLIVSAFALISGERRLRHERDSVSTQIMQKFAEELFQHRLRLYPGAFIATIDVGKGDAEDESLPEKHRTALQELRAWKSGEVELVISDDAEDKYQELVERLKKNPGRGAKYNKDQLNKIWDARQKFRGALRRDLGLMRLASSLRINLPKT